MNRAKPDQSAMAGRHPSLRAGEGWAGAEIRIASVSPAFCSDEEALFFEPLVHVGDELTVAVPH
jgi:hypothetical protein